jgi:hypothetical protein
LDRDMVPSIETRRLQKLLRVCQGRIGAFCQVRRRLDELVST